MCHIGFGFTSKKKTNILLQPNQVKGTTVLSLSVPSVLFCFMDGKSCAQVLTAGLLAQGYGDSLAASELAE